MSQETKGANVNQETANKRIDSLRERLKEIGDRQKVLDTKMHVLLKKQAVLGEIGYSARHAPGLSDAARCELLAAVIYGLDHPDSWWHGVDAGDELTIAEWMLTLRQAYRAAREAGMVVDKITACHQL